MRLTIHGTGYVGLVTGACFAEVGNEVVCVDIDGSKIERLQQGEIPLYEPGLEDLVRRNGAAGRLSFTTDVAAGVGHGLFQFIAVGTPPDEDGSADLQHVRQVARSIAEHMDDYRIIVHKSTVPVGTAHQVESLAKEVLAERRVALELDVVSNPEFLKEGAAIEDFMRPDRIVIGTDNPRTRELLRELYGPFNRSRDRIVATDVRSAELTKYAANAMLATKISFMNELANLAELLGADIEQVRRGIGADERIGYHFIYPGCGFGGSCFPKDVQALRQTANAVNFPTPLLRAVETVNNQQKRVLFQKISSYFGGDLTGRTLAVWGLSFKPNTDDMREASSRVLIESLWDAGAKVRAHDPEAMQEAHRVWGDREDLFLCGSPEEALEGADALAIVTEWSLFRSPDFGRVRSSLKNPVIFDGRNLYEPALMRQAGFQYFGIGRGTERLIVDADG
jgi:UDPglucose 6-dehydrogenase